MDFAYAVHSEVGDICVGTRINGKIMPLRTELQNGDQVEIITSKAQTPSPTWESFVVTGKARARIRRVVRLRQLEEYANLGKSIIQRSFTQAGYEYSNSALDDVLSVFSASSASDIWAEVGSGHITGRQVLEAVFPGSKQEKDGPGILPPDPSSVPTSVPNGDALPISGLIAGMAVHFASCCHALPGDRIVGIISKGRGMNIHTIDCENLAEFTDAPERWVDLAWEAGAASRDVHVSRIKLVVINEPGSLGALSTVIAKNGANISNLKITRRSTDFFDLMIDVEVRDLKHMTNIVAALRATPVICSVERARG